MDQLTNDFNTLGRIIIAIKLYRRQTADHGDLSNNKAVDIYLKEHLSGYDWLFWQGVHTNDLPRTVGVGYA